MFCVIVLARALVAIENVIFVTPVNQQLGLVLHLPTPTYATACLSSKKWDNNLYADKA